MFTEKDKEESENAFHLSVSQMWCMCANISYHFFLGGVWIWRAEQMLS